MFIGEAFPNLHAVQSEPGLSSTFGNIPSDDPFIVSTPGLPHPPLGHEKSFEIQHITNLRDTVPGWDDDEIDEVMLLSPKSKSNLDNKVLSIVEEGFEGSDIIERTNISDFHILRIIYIGNTCRVLLGQRAHTSLLFSIKLYDKPLIDKKALDRIVTEQTILRRITELQLPFVPQLRWSFQDEDALYLVTENHTGGKSLSNVIDGASLSPELVRFYASELVEAIYALQATRIVHRNIQPDNIVIASDGHLVLTNFEQAAFVQHRLLLNNAALNSEVALTMQTRDRAPEIILGWPHDGKVDVWGFGLVLYYMLTGEHPFLEDSTQTGYELMKNLVLHREFRTEHLTATDTDSRAIRLMKSCLERNPSIRLSVEDIKSHEYFTDTDWIKVRAKSQQAPVIHPSWSFNQQSKSANFEDVIIMEMGMQTEYTHVEGFSFALNSNYLASMHDGPRQENPSELTLDTVSGLGNKTGTTLSRLDNACAAIDYSSVPLSSVSGSASMSCTSFGELRFPKAPTTYQAMPPLPTKTKSATVTLEIPAARHAMELDDAQITAATTPTSETCTQGHSAFSPATTNPRVKLRKYASLDFELDTVVSLSQESEGLTGNRPLEVKTNPLVQLPRWPGSPLKSFRIIPRSHSPGRQTQQTPSPFGLDQTLPASHSKSDFFATQAMNKLRKKPRTPRPHSSPPTITPSKPVPIPNLPQGIEQIGNGIGYTHARSPGAWNLGVNASATTPKRSMSSFMPNTSRLFGDFPQIRGRLLGKKRADGNLEKNLGTGGEREGEEDEMDAVMREIYGSTWDLNLGYSHPQSSNAAGLGFGVPVGTALPKTPTRTAGSTALLSGLEIGGGDGSPCSLDLDNSFRVASTLRLVSPRPDQEEF